MAYENVALTITVNGSSDIDFSNHHLRIRDGAKVVINDGGKLEPTELIQVREFMVHDFLTSMYPDKADFVFTVSRHFVRCGQTPLLIAPDDVPPHKVAMEVASLAPNAEVTIYPWKDSQRHIYETVEHPRRFLKSYEPVKV